MFNTTFLSLAEQLGQLHSATQRAAVQQVNYWLTARNWLVGYYVTEYEQAGQDRAAYGQQLLRELARTLRARGVPAASPTPTSNSAVSSTSPIHSFCWRKPVPSRRQVFPCRQLVRRCLTNCRGRAH